MPIPVSLTANAITAFALSSAGFANRRPFSAERTVSVVAPLDYRRLPWIPIVGMLTVLAGVLLYVRTPRARAAASRPNRVEEGTLEELE